MHTAPDAWTLGVDVGGTRLKLAAIARVEGQPVQVLGRHVQHLRPADRSPQGLVCALVDGVRALQDTLPVRTRELRIAGVGLGVPGVIDARDGRIIESPNLPWLNDFALGPALGLALGVRVAADNDANCVGWGEAMAGAGQGAPDQVCLALGTGVGGGLVLGGRLHRGTRGRGGELGHICVQPGGAPCGCGSRGCLEQYASQTGLLRMMRERGLRPEGRAPEADDVVWLFAQARDGDRAAAEVVGLAGRALGQAIAGLHRTFDLPLVVIAGGISAALPDLRPAMQRAIDTCAPSHAPGVPAVVAGTLGTDAGCIGAAALTWDCTA